MSSSGLLTHQDPARAEIVLSWRRAELDGIDPGSASAPQILDTDRTSRLMVAAAPVLRDLETRLAGQAFCVILADRDCRVVYAWSGCATLRSALERRGVALGAGLSENTAGTNGLGTALEIERSIAVNGDEHFLEVLKGFSCFGHPVRHPLTRRIEGVLDITSAGDRVNPLSGALLAGAVREIESRLVEGAREADRRLFLAFQNATRLRSTPVAVLGGDVVLANRACLDRLRSIDPSMLRTLVGDGTHPRQSIRDLDLGAGERVRVLIEALDGTDGGALFRLGDVETTAPADHVVPVAGSPRRVLVCGEPGTGRSSHVRSLAGQAEVVSFDAADAVTGSEDRWLSRVVAALDDRSHAVVIENVHLLPARLSEVVRSLIGKRADSRVLLTGCPPEELPVSAERLAAGCARVELEPLRTRTQELPAIIATIVAAIRPRVDATFTPRALAELADHPWPGNLVELTALIHDLVRRHPTGRIDDGHLPARYRSTARTASLGGRERAERLALLSALETSGGNKVRAAAELGISRTTLYRRMQALGIPG